jgi:phage terminase large subunit-like protein
MNGWETALPDWESRILSGQSLVPKLPLFESEAARALRVFKRLKLPDVIGTPTMEEACGPWFFPIVEALFGSYDPDRSSTDGRRPNSF